MPMTLEQHKAYIELLTDFMVIHFNQIHDLQLRVGEALKEAGEAHGLSAVSLAEDAVKKIKAATLYALPVDFSFKM
jgi:hypothetical protein